jgi:hypothetical protein
LIARRPDVLTLQQGLSHRRDKPGPQHELDCKYLSDFNADG